MPALRGRPFWAALVGYLFVAVLFAWPLPLHFGTMVPGTVGGDTGVYIWNLWVFRHEILQGHFPFFTVQILSVTPSVPLTLHNYTTFANILAFPLLPLVGTVATFNTLLVASVVTSAFAMFLFARRVTGDNAAAWVAGLFFGFSPFMNARFAEHFSLVQAAPLPLFALVIDRLRTAPSTRLAAAAGLIVAWAFLSDPYYAVYCLLMAAFAAVYGVVSIKLMAARPVAIGWRALLDVCIICLAGLIAGIVVRGGGRFEILGITVSMHRLYTPVLALTLLVAVRVWMEIRPRVTVMLPPLRPQARVFAVGALACIALLSPVLSAMARPIAERQFISPTVLWRSSAGGMDLLAFFVPNPLHPLWGEYFKRGIQRMPDGFVENVTSIPWVAIALLVVAAAFARTRFPRYWIAFTAFFGLLALGPFVEIAGMKTYVPTPWALLRYVPVVGAARMPTRFSILVMFGVAILIGLALRDLRATWRRPAAGTAIVVALLLFELMPAPREVHSARVPAIYEIIRNDPRPIRILQLPFGLRDGMSSAGNFSAEYQFFQTVHGKRLIGGYLSRLPKDEVARYRQFRFMRVLLDLSAGELITEERFQRAALTSRQTLQDLNVGYVVINTDRASKQLQAFALQSFGLTYVASDGPHVLYKTSVK
jgi:hypothetical protein